MARFDRAVAGEPVERFGFGGGPRGFRQPAKPIKGFVVARARSVSDQLSGKSQGETLAEDRFGGRSGWRPGPRGRDGFGPGSFLAGRFMEAFDKNKDGKVSHDEFTAGFAKWFSEWNTDSSGALTETQLRVGINRDLSPFRGGPPDGTGFGPPRGGPGDEP
jgi:hypothetical protein